jgi:hypothetical protein
MYTYGHIKFYFQILDTQEENYRAYKYFSILDSDNSGIWYIYTHIYIHVCTYV